LNRREALVSEEGVEEKAQNSLSTSPLYSGTMGAKEY